MGFSFKFPGHLKILYFSKKSEKITKLLILPIKENFLRKSKTCLMDSGMRERYLCYV